MKKGMGMVGLIALIAAAALGLINGLRPATLASGQQIISIVLIVAGVFYAIMALTKVESVPFLLAVLVLGGASTAFAMIPSLGSVINAVFASISLLVWPAAVVGAFKVIYDKMK